MSQKDGVTETIGDHEYIMYMLPPIKSHNLLMDVARMVAPAIGDAVGALLSGKSDEKKADILEQEIGPELISSAISKLARDVNQKTSEKLISTFREMTHVDGKQLDKIFDDHFRGALDEMYKWLFWGMRVQWGKSLSALVSGASGQGAAGGLASLLQSPNTLTGSSGD